MNGAATTGAAPSRGRGRGRGGARGGARGAGAFGVPRHTNLSWRKSDDADSPALDKDDAAEEPDRATGSAFGAGGSAFSAFGGGTNGFGGSAFSSSGDLSGQPAASTSAFGTPPSNSFGKKAFGDAAAAVSSAYGPAPTTSSRPFGGSAFSGSAFGATSKGSAPLFRAPSQQSSGGDGNAAVASAAERRVPGQASALEVLGEDSDARKKRFEATLPNNRYLELKPLREEQRLAEIRAGTIPDPSKPMRLDQATDFEGTCEDMCPEWEREEREYQNNVDPLERYPGTTRIDPARAVKAFHRPAAGNDQPLPSDVRPAPVLHRTLDYLFHDLLPTQPLAATHPFIRDRTRSIRQDFTVQNLRNLDAIRCNERIARYHILAVGVLREETGFSEQQELEQLRKVLKSLNEFYDDLRLSGEEKPSENEAEFRAYNILTHLRDPDIVWSVELLPSYIFGHPLLQRALALHRLAQKANVPRGERACQNAFSRFFKLVSDPATPYLFACILSTHFNDVRRNAVDALRSAYLKQHSAFPLRTLAKVLGCDDEDDARSLCEQLGIVVRADEHGRTVAELHKQAALKSVALKPKVARRLVEGKRGDCSYSRVIDGTLQESRAVQQIPRTPLLAGRTSPAASRPPPPGVPSLAKPASSANPPPQRGFGFNISQISTPIPTPPRLATPIPAPARVTVGLDAAAPSFVPSSVAPTAPTSQSQDSSFQGFAPTAVPFVPAQPAARADKPSPLTPSFTIPAATPRAPAFPAPLPPDVRQAKTRPSLSAASAPLPTIRKVSLPRISPERPSPVAQAALARRTQLVQDLVRHFTAAFVRETVEGPVHRAATTALKERWADVRAKEARTRQAMAASLATDTVLRLGRLATRETLFKGWRDARCLRSALGEWRRGLEQTLDRKAREAELRSGWREVVGALEAHPAAAAGDFTMIGEPDDDGLAGSNDLPGLSFDRLLIGSAEAPGGPAANDADFVSRLSSAAVERDQIWAPGTFLDIVARSASEGIKRVELQKARPAWDVLVSISATQSPFASWLACKFDLDPSDSTAHIDTPEADISVKMVDYGTKLERNMLGNVGLVIFVYSRDTSSNPRTHLHRLMTRVRAESLFTPTLLILDCTEADASDPEDALSLGSFDGRVAWRTYRPDLAAAEEDFTKHVEELLRSLHVLPGRFKVPLEASMRPLRTAWKASLARAHVDDDGAAPTSLARAGLKILQNIASEVEGLTVDRSGPALCLPDLPADAESLPQAVRAVIRSAAFAQAANFPSLETLLAARPPPTTAVLARALVEHVEEFVFSVLSTRHARQEAVTTEIPAIYQSLKTALTDLEERFKPVPWTSRTTSKKRRASAVQEAEGTVSRPKKQAGLVNAVNGATASTSQPRDRLSALEVLMRDARALIAS